MEIQAGRRGLLKSNTGEITVEVVDVFPAPAAGLEPQVMFKVVGVSKEYAGGLTVGQVEMLPASFIAKVLAE